MRVLVVSNMYPTEAEPWAGCFVKEQVEDLRALGADVDVLHFDGRRDKLAYARAARAVRSRVRERRYDVIHAHYGLSGAVALAQKRVPVVTTFTGSDTGYIPWQRYVSWVVARRSQPVFVTRDGGRRLGCEGAPIVPAAVDLERFVPVDRSGARRSLGWDEERPYVLFPASRSRAVKRADLFDAAVDVARRELPDLQTASLENLDRERVALVLNAVDATLMTSDSEGSPVTVKESLACLTPVVSVPVGDVAESIRGLPGCAVVPRDPEALGEALVSAIRSERSALLRRRVEGFGRRRAAERIAQLYRDVVASR